MIADLYEKFLAKICQHDAIPVSRRVERKILLEEIMSELDDYADYILADLARCQHFQTLSSTVALAINANLKFLQRSAIRSLVPQLLPQTIAHYDCEFLPKLDGDQLGNRMVLRYKLLSSSDIQQEKTLYIKTHQVGSRRQSSSIKPVDLKELFFYKLLQHSGYGPKVYFYLNYLAVGGVYIATQDESFSKSNPGKLFQTHGQLRVTDTSLQPTDFHQQGLATLELLARLFNLWDIMTNPGNFGCVSKNQHFIKWRIIDFRVETLDSYQVDDLFDQFCDGSTMVGYVGILQDFLQALSVARRVELACQIFAEFTSGRAKNSLTGFHLPLLEAMSLAFVDTVSFADQQQDYLGLDPVAAKADLTKYCNDVRKNMQTFQYKLDAWCKEHTQSAKLALS